MTTPKKPLRYLIPIAISLVGTSAWIMLIWFVAPTDEGWIGKAVITLLVPGLYGLHLSFVGKEQATTGAFVYSLLLAGILLMGVGSVHQVPGLTGAVFFLGATVPAVWLYWMIAGKSLILRLWFVPIAGSASLALGLPDFLTVELLDFALAPFMVAAYGCVVWALLAKWSLGLVERYRYSFLHRRFHRPGMEAVSMALLAMPIVAFAMLAVNALQVGGIWVAVSGAVVSMLFGSVVSEPFGRLLVNLRDSRT